jgi:hypothetical protein
VIESEGRRRRRYRNRIDAIVVDGVCCLERTAALAPYINKSKIFQAKELRWN